MAVCRPLVTDEEHAALQATVSSAVNIKYVPETWTLLQEDLRKLEVFHMRSQRMILGIRWHDFVRNTEVVDRTNLFCVQDIIDIEIHCSAMW